MPGSILSPERTCDRNGSLDALRMREDLSRASSVCPPASSRWGPTTARTTNGPAHRVHVDAFYISDPSGHRRQYAEFARETGHRAPGIRDLPLVVDARARIVFPRAGGAVRLARRRAAARARPASGHARHARRRDRLLPLAERPHRPPRAAADRSRMGARGARRPRRSAVSVGRRHRCVARELPARSGAEAASRHAAGRLLSAERSAALRHDRQRVGVGGRLVSPDTYRDGERPQPARPGSGTLRLVRGGSWVTHDVDQLRCAHRHKVPPDTYAYSIGFRVVYSDDGSS